VILERADWPLWLGEVEGDVPALLRPLPEGVLRIWPIDRQIGQVRNDGPQLLEPLPDPKRTPEPTLLWNGRVRDFGG
jgi:putative SOS response-associated peptidase YedK